MKRNNALNEVNKAGLSIQLRAIRSPPQIATTSHLRQKKEIKRLMVTTVADYFTGVFVEGVDPSKLSSNQHPVHAYSLSNVEVTIMIP